MSRPRRICAEGAARRLKPCRCERFPAELTQRVGAALQQLARNRQARTVVTEASRGLTVIVTVRAAAAARLLHGLE